MEIVYRYSMDLVIFFPVQLLALLHYIVLRAMSALTFSFWELG